MSYNTQPSPGYMPYPEIPASDSGKGWAIAGFILGVLNLCSWFLPICGGPMSVVGIILSSLGLKSTSLKGLAIAGLVLSIIGILLTIVNAIFGAVLGVNNYINTSSYY